jgi:predicted HAD superfamily Cof-like phosphohydrolase
MVTDFHEAYGLPVGTVEVKDDPTKIKPEDADRIMLREALNKEEYKELREARTKEEIMKESCDLVYVILGMFVEFGWDFHEAFSRVHASNMSKLDEEGNPILREDGKVLKGPNYFTPDLTDLVE